MSKIDKTKLLFTGDLAITSSFFGSDITRNPFKRVNELFKESDISLINLEGPISGNRETTREDVTAILFNDKKLFEHLSPSNTAVFNLANNHIFDYGPIGFKQTVDYLEKKNFKYSGAGLNEHEADKELIVDVHSQKFALLNYSSDEQNVGAIVAGSEIAGCASYSDIDKIINKISTLRKQSIFICVSLHWGNEYYKYPNPEQIRIAHKLVDAGANLIIGHHPHVIQGIEIYKNSLIAYSLGNFFIPSIEFKSGRKRIQQKMEKEIVLLQIEVCDCKISEYHLIIGKIKNNSQFFYSGRKLTKRINYLIDELSKPISNPNYHDYFERYKKKRKKQMQIVSLLFAFRKLINFKTIKEIKKDDFVRQWDRFKKIL